MHLPTAVFLASAIATFLRSTYAEDSIRRKKRLTTCSCTPGLVTCNCHFPDKEHRKCECARELTMAEKQQESRHCRCTNMESKLWEQCKFSCQEKCFEKCLNSDAGLKCLEECGPICLEACSKLKDDSKVNAIQLVIQKRSQCHSACTQSCALSCRNQKRFNRTPCKKKCQETCEQTCTAVAPADTLLPQATSVCHPNCLSSCQQSCLAKPGQRDITANCLEECQHACKQVCRAETIDITQVSADVQPPVIYVQDQLSQTNAPETRYESEKHKTVEELANISDFASCANHCNLFCNERSDEKSCGKDCLKACYEMDKEDGMPEVSGCRTRCPAACIDYCNTQIPNEREVCKNECKKACALACNADILKIVTKKKQPKTTFSSYPVTAQALASQNNNALDTTTLEDYFFARFNDPGTSQEESDPNHTNLVTTISVFSHNRSEILDCQTRCAKYCNENYHGSECISECQQTCLEGAIQEAQKRSLVTTLSIGPVKRERRRPQILPCNQGSKPTGENCGCPDGYSQCGVNQCCRK